MMMALCVMEFPRGARGLDMSTLYVVAVVASVTLVVSLAAARVALDKIIPPEQ